MLRRTALLLLAVASRNVLAQNPSPQAVATPPPTGSVTGHVICSDTQRPARFADVYLLPKIQASRNDKERRVMLIRSRTAVDGSFTITHVAPGDYFAIPHAPGYLLPVALDDKLSSVGDNTDPDLSKALSYFPVLHVVADRTASVELSMQRGAVIAGRAMYDDGSPISGTFVHFEPVNDKNPEQQYLGRVFGDINTSDRSVATDDEGYFRIPALRPGKYRVSLSMWVSMDERTVGNSQSWGVNGNGLQLQEIDIFSPGVFRRSEAHVIELHEGELRSDVNFSLKLDGLHEVSGRLLGGDDHHPINGANITIKDNEDFKRTAYVHEDGSYSFSYVPSGTYQLDVNEAFDVEVAAELRDTEFLRSYVPMHQTILVGEQDLRVGDIQLSEQKQEPDKQP